MNHIWRTIPVAASLAAASLISACGGGGSSSDPGQGTLAVSMTDAPACGFDQVNVTVSKVRVHKNADASENDAGWSDIVLSQPKKINLLDLTNGVMQTLGQTTLPAGHYTQVRLVLDGSQPLANSVIPSGGTETALSTPSALQSGIKLNGQFDVAADSVTDIALDFDACKSVVKRGNGGYNLKPVISVIPMVISGAINGYVDPAVASASSPVISAQVNGAIIKSTVPDSSGRFSLFPLVAGNYTVVVTADARATDVIDGIPVSANIGTEISTSTTPIAMQPSATNMVSGIVSPANAEALVSATQTFDAGQKVTVKFVNADAQSGAYSMSLPTAAPSLGRYGALPISLVQQAPIAGKYAVEAGASGYAGQSYLVDLLNAAALVNFTF